MPDLREEFFRQGDFEKANGMECSPNSDREHMDVENSQIAFYHSVCFLLFKLNAKVSPSLQVLVEQIKRNMTAWEKILEEKRGKMDKDKDNETENDKKKIKKKEGNEKNNNEKRKDNKNPTPPTEE